MRALKSILKREEIMQSRNSISTDATSCEKGWPAIKLNGNTSWIILLFAGSFHDDPPTA